MRGSAAFIGLKYPFVPQASDFFDVVTHDPAQLKIEPKQLDPEAPRKRGHRHSEPEDD